MSARTLFIGWLLVLPLTAWAERGDLPAKTSGPYLGIGGGYNKIDTRAGSITVGGESIGYRVLGGYRFANFPLPFNLDVGIEAAYVDFGSVDENTFGAHIQVELTGISVAGVVYLPVSRYFDVFGKFGAYQWDGQVRTDGTKTSDDSSTDLSYGLGLAMQTGSTLGAQLEIESLDTLDGVWVATLSVTYQFK